MKKILSSIFAVFIVYPMLIGLIISVSSNEEVADGLSKIPFFDSNFLNSFLDNYIPNDAKLGISLIYTTLISFFSSFLIILISFLSGFYISRHHKKLSKFTIIFAVIIYSIPSILFPASMIRYLSSNSLVLNSIILIITHFIYLFPFIIYIMLNYFNYVPFSFDRQSAMDGIGTRYFITRIIFPYLSPVLLILFLIVFIIIFNDTLFSTFLSSNPEYRFIGYYIMENIYSPDQDIFRYAELSSLGNYISLFLIIISYIVLNKYNTYLQNELKNNI